MLYIHVTHLIGWCFRFKLLGILQRQVGHCFDVFRLRTKNKKNESPNQIAQCKLQASLSRWINCTWCVLLSNSCVLRAISLVSSHFWWMFHGIYEIRQLNTETLSPGNVGMGSCRFDGIQGKYHWDIPQIPTISSKSWPENSQSSSAKHRSHTFHDLCNVRPPR